MIAPTITQTPRSNNFENTVGIHEAGGYLSKGKYLQQMDCMMKSNVPEKFCDVCQRSIKKMINFTIGKTN